MKEICHLMYLDKFSKPFYLLIKNHFTSQPHHFITYGESVSDYVPDFSENHLTNRLSAFINAIPTLNRSDKVILHGAFSTKVLFYLMLQPWLWNKVYWVIWGKDLQFFNNRKRSISYVIRKFVLSRVKAYITYLPEDYEKAKCLINAKPVFRECIAYPSNVVSDFDDRDCERKKLKIIMVGNSADPSNSHVDVFDKLVGSKDEISKLIVPLSYGDKIYAAEIIEKGQAIFKDKFSPLTEMLPLNDYKKILKQIDLAFFNHDRQQAMGNTIYLLSLGKTVYMRENTPSWLFFESKGVVLKSIKDDELEYIAPSESMSNKRAIFKYFNEENLVKQWTAIFNE
ncbi:TDP-N-acetylfucosamine:lipid II N-acetylfucosaminyltransferase [Rheinheimera sp. MM224]|uniref:TDP-N-acetylfucosamine:lipid II N-acetylfucosaminyltransferase n=1 Tax=Rheinheimera sp. MM224 TaxID=3019969 RepID=UPI0021F87EC1|nr:TDP-N-acetylfucosamine:lipid II N-acetylfucosaminyltransferase [Rheinheimera sp. MM224]CAI3796493.1 TDP-N-acetylfucosamine:lipid II N-acetylfucosaminyltransferase [Rheinheimera sp. MM224]